MTEFIVFNLALLNWAEFPLVSILFRDFLICFPGVVFNFFFFPRRISVGMDLKECHAKPIQHLKTIHISEMGQPACPYLVSVSTGEGEKKGNSRGNSGMKFS